ncbi:MAG: hypothetical protein QOG33_2758, partial [Gaiellales bacterium]|nr:hypothetical protein [Gaiellales bacterium]
MSASLRLLLAAAAGAALLVLAYVLLGGLDYRPLGTGDPCKPR